MSIEKKILENISFFKKKDKKKKNQDKENSNDDFFDSANKYGKKISFILFILFFAYVFSISSNDKDSPLNKIKDNFKEINNKSQEVVGSLNENAKDTKNVINHQKEYTIVSKNFLNSINYDEYIFINFTDNKNYIFNRPDGKKVNLLDLKIDMNGFSNLGNFDVLDKDGKYIILVSDISDTIQLKEILKNKKFKYVYFKLI